LRFWTHGVGTMTYGAEVTRLGFATQFSMAVDVEARWHHLGATDLGTEAPSLVLASEC